MNETFYLNLEQSVEKHLSNATYLQEEGDYEAALHECDLALEIAPDSVEAHYLRGLILDAQERVPEAVAAYRRAWELDPHFEAARINLEAAEQELASPPAPRSEEASALDAAPGEDVESLDAKDLMLVATFPYTTQAYLLANSLQAAGIPVYVFDSTVVNIFANIVGGVKVCVPAAYWEDTQTFMSQRGFNAPVSAAEQTGGVEELPLEEQDISSTDVEI